MKWEWQWKQVLIGFFAIGLLLRLPNLDTPREIVFDEIYFGNFSSAYCCSHNSFFDIHPPHGKLLIAASAKLFGHQSGFDYRAIGQTYTPEVAVFGMRLIPALAGALIPCLAAYLVMLWGGGIYAAMFCGFLLTWDSALWVQSRIIAIDPILISAILLSLIFTALALKSDDMKKRTRWILAAGSAAGLAVGCKFTGMACLPLIFVLLVLGTLKSRHPRRWLILLRQMLWFVGGFMVVYLSGWWLHFYLLTNPGPGDAFFRPSGEFFKDLVDLHQIMFEKNAGITAQHPYASLWYTWPIMQRPIFYWSSGDRFIYLLGNPVVWYGVLIAFLLGIGVWLEQAFQLVRAKRLTDVFNIPGTWALAAVVVSFGPLMRVSRPLFLYHYFSTLIFMTIFSCLILPTMAQRVRLFSGKWRRHIYLVACMIVVLGFVAVLPMTSMTNFAIEYRDWVYMHLPNWR